MTLSRRQFLAAMGVGVTSWLTPLSLTARQSTYSSENQSASSSRRVALISAYVVLRTWAHDDAGARARLSQDTVLYVTDRLTTHDGDWIAVSDDHGLTGWSRASVWRPIEII